MTKIIMVNKSIGIKLEEWGEELDFLIDLYSLFESLLYHYFNTSRAAFFLRVVFTVMAAKSPNVRLYKHKFKYENPCSNKKRSTGNNIKPHNTGEN